MTASSFHRAYLAEFLRRADAARAAAWDGIVARRWNGEVPQDVPLDTGEGIPLIVVELHYGPAATEAVLDGEALPIKAVLTGDGGGYVPEWHAGAPSGDSVYIERWEEGVRTFHGWIDPVTRRIVQTG